MKSLYNRSTDRPRAFVLRYHAWVAGAMLALMLGLGLSSMVGNSAIVDEIAHIPAGYSYLHFGDYRLNPEHPPLIKDLAGLPLQFMNLKFPTDRQEWTTDVNGQWQAGWDFLYNLGNNAGTILFWARLPILLLMVGFGAWLYWMVRKHWGTGVALLALAFYTLSPNFLGHGALVTTDLGASIFMFLAILTFARFIKLPTATNLFLLSLALAGANLAKFSSVLLYPFLGLISLFVVWSMKSPKPWKTRLGLYTGGYITAAALSVVWIWIFYIPHVWNMPTSVQDRLIVGSLASPNMQFVVHILVPMSHVVLFKPLAQYLLGVAMVFGRVAGGNVTYFNGMVTNQSFHGYFPELFVLKTQVALLILMLVVSLFGVWRAYSKTRSQRRKWLGASFRKHLLEWMLGSFATFYFGISVAGNLNLGIRHILPVYLPVFVLVAIGTVKIMRRLARTRYRVVAAMALAVLVSWYGLSAIWAAPNFIAYFNELVGGPGNAYKYFTDSGVDWGQDLVRLKEYVDMHPGINHLAIDYFGGGVPQYYFCARKYDAQGRMLTNGDYDCSHSKIEEWHSQNGQYSGQYIAVSETFLMNDEWYAEINNRLGYGYLRERKPVAKIGYSIYLYKLY
jgi:4-amino-4-deoxy-L-arabinose transferase-like glycosyltransferase